MLNENQIQSVWERQLGAETRSLYFGELTTRYSKRKQLITGLSFFLSSGAAAALAGKAPAIIPLLLSAIVALVTAYSMAIGLDNKIRTMAKLHYEWNQLASSYERLWSNVYADDAQETLRHLMDREGDLSQLAATEAPNDQRSLERWQDQVFRLHGITAG